MLAAGLCLAPAARADLPPLLSPSPPAAPQATSATLTASSARTVTGHVVTYTATVTPAPDGGTVTLVDGAGKIPGCTSLPLAPGRGRASCRTSYSDPGVQPIRAEYSGDARYASAQSPQLRTLVAPSLTLGRRQRQILGGEILRLLCARASGGCRAAATLTSSRGRLLGAERATIAAGHATRLTVGLDHAGKLLLLHAGRLRALLTITSTVDGARAVVASERLSWRAPSAAQQVSGAEIIAYAKRFIGTPYVYGGNGPQVFDCSGFTVYVFAHFGYHLERSSWAQMMQGLPVTGPLKLGDLVFWDNGGHVGIYTGHDTFISATVHRGIWIYSFAVWEQTQTYTTARQILDSPRGALASIAVAGLPRNGGPADATP